VEAGPGRRVEPVVEDLPEQVVGEAPGAELVGRADQHPGPGGLTEQGQHRADGLAGDPGQDRRAQVGAEHRGGLQQPDAGVAEAGQPAPDRVAHPVGERGRVQVSDQQPADLLDEERVAAGPVLHAGAELGVGLPPGDPGEQPCHLPGVEAAQRQRPALRRQPGDRAGERVAGRDLDVTVGGDQQLAAAADPPGMEGGQLDRGRVGPVQVVEHQHQRARAGGLEQGGADGVEALEPGRRRGRPPWPVAAGEDGLDAEGGQRLLPGPERRGALPAGTPGDGGASRLGPVGGRRGQGRLADPGLAGEGDEPAPGRQGGLDQGPQLGEGPVAADETGRGRRHAPDGAMTPTPVQGQQALTASRSSIRWTVPSETVSV
jgi:hypothetical protein